MSSIHSSDLPDEERNMYVFPRAIINEELLAALDIYNRRQRLIECELHIQLVPAYPYFISVDDLLWAYKELIYITQEQVDKFLILYNVLDMSFLDYIEGELTK